MDPNRRYKIKAPDDIRYDQARQILREKAVVQLENAKRRTIAATRIDDDTENKLRSLEVKITEDFAYDLD